MRLPFSVTDIVIMVVVIIVTNFS